MPGSGQALTRHCLDTEEVRTSSVDRQTCGPSLTIAWAGRAEGVPKESDVT